MLHNVPQSDSAFLFLIFLFLLNVFKLLVFITKTFLERPLSVLNVLLNAIRLCNKDFIIFKKFSMVQNQWATVLHISEEMGGQ